VTFPATEPEELKEFGESYVLSLAYAIPYTYSDLLNDLKLAKELLIA
jgi:hypothetical protein